VPVLIWLNQFTVGKWCIGKVQLCCCCCCKTKARNPGLIASEESEDDLSDPETNLLNSSIGQQSTRNNEQAF